MRVGRNESCPCGSGKKFKACCEGKRSRGMSRGLIGLLAAIGVIATVGVVASIRNEQKPAPLPAATARTPRAQPAGAAPPGKVWSTEHGHWHDAAPRQGGNGNAGAAPIQATQATVPVQRKPQPPGPAPAGKVWSAEHGHWHDARTP
jgi:SEC-C motif